MLERVEEPVLSARLVRALYRAGIVTPRALLGRTREWLSRQPGIGPAVLEEIDLLLRDNGWKLAE